MIFVLVANIVIATISAQSLVHLPGAPPNNFKIYAGYFDVNGTDADDTESIHYMLEILIKNLMIRIFCKYIGI